MIDKKKYSTIEKRKLNISLALLRMYLSFLVVNAHLFNVKKSIIKNKYLLKFLKNKISVPIFFIMSFFFNHKSISSKDKIKIKKRFERLLIPYFIWPIIIFVVNNIVYYTFKLKLKTTFKDLYIQYKTGHNIVAVLWFQLNLIISTLLILFIQILFPSSILFILFNLQILSFFIQYSHFNYQIFSKYNRYIKNPYGRFMEILPYCIIGYIISYLNIIVYLKQFYLKAIYTLNLILLFFTKYNIIEGTKGFMYQGFKLNIISLIIFLIVALQPSEKITNIYIIKIIKIFTNFTSGVYYLHIPMYKYLSNYIKLIKRKDIFGCLIIYMICYFISFLGLKFFSKTKLVNLFL